MRARKVFMTLGVAVIAVTGCAQMPATVQQYKTQKSGEQMPSPTQQDKSQQDNSVVIFIYPQNGLISSGQYYRLPLEQASVHEETGRKLP